MSKLIYQVEFLSDIVLPATSNTEGNITQLDFIPGSNFLGMVAKEYQNFVDSFKVFHSGAVKFGDATVLKDGKQTYKMPLSYFHKKLNSEIFYNHHKLKEKDFLPEDKGGLGQLKQKRNGYITKDKEIVEIDYNYSQKSAYDKTHRRSLDGSMYGYSAIQSGTKWQFAIEYDETILKDDLELLKSTIVGKQKLGKSKSAEYGLVEIKEVQTKKENIKDNTSDDLILYFNSRVALVDDEGNPTYDLKYLFNGITEDNIDYSKSQIRTSLFTPYNGARKTKDYERVCINKGSVIVLKNIDKKVPKYVGAYQSEGFGEVLINPTFLSEYSLSLEKTDDKKEEFQKVVPTQTLSKFLQQREDTKQAKIKLGEEVADFIKDKGHKFDKKMNSQWGTIRSLCNKNSDNSIYDEVKEYISKGVAKEKWKGDKSKVLLEVIKNSKNPIEFTKLLAMQMPKEKEKKEQSND